VVRSVVYAEFSLWPASLVGQRLPTLWRGQEYSAYRAIKSKQDVRC